MTIARDTVAVMGASGSWQQANAFPEIIPAAVSTARSPQGPSNHICEIFDGDAHIP